VSVLNRSTRKLIAVFLALLLCWGPVPLQAEAPPLPAKVPAVGVTPPLTLDQPISLDYVDANLTTVLKSIAYSYDLNIVISKAVTGKVSARLKNVSLDEALDCILRVNKYRYSRKENIVYIISDSEADLQTEFFSLKYLTAKAAQGFIAKNISGEGEIQVNEMTNSLLVRDHADNLEIVREILAGADQQPLQVLIEAKLVDINSTDAETLGTSLEATLNPKGHLSSATITTGGEGAITDSLASGGGLLELVPRFKSLSNANVTISALIEKNKARILASPSIATLSGLEAKIIIGDRIPYRDATTSVASGGTSTTTSTQNFVEVGTKLQVTPYVSADGWITMKIHPEVSNLTGYSDDGVPLVGTREADATIRVRDNETIIIGGLIKSEQSSNEDGVPGLRTLPVLGWFFKKHVARDVNSELVVFITPHIIRSSQDRLAATASISSAATVVPLAAAVPDAPREVYIDKNFVGADTSLLQAALHYVDSLQKDIARDPANSLYLNTELIKAYKQILLQFPNSGKADLCLYKIAQIYVKEFKKCEPARLALENMKELSPDSPYITLTESLVDMCAMSGARKSYDADVAVLGK